MGYVKYVMSGTMLSIISILKTNGEQVQLLVGILNICAFVSSLNTGRVSNWVGHRRTSSLVVHIFLAGFIPMGLTVNFAMHLAGYCIAGVDVGYTLMIVLIYATEIAFAEIRGSGTSLPETCTNFGILIDYRANYFLPSCRWSMADALGPHTRCQHVGA